MTPEEIRDAVDAQYDSFAATIDTNQDDYIKLSTNRGYFQGLRTHSTIPADGTETAPDRIRPGDRPTDQTAPWPQDIFPARMSGALTINTYEGDSGIGEVRMLAVEIEGDYWQRDINRGPDRTRDKAWRIVNLVPWAP